MEPHLRDQIYSKFLEDWGDSSSQYTICKNIFDYLLSRPLEQLRHLTPGSLKNAVAMELSNAEFLEAAQYLSGDRIRILSLHFELLYNDEYFEIDNREVMLANTTGKLEHPETGELIENFGDKLFMYFSPTSVIRETKGG